MDVIRSQRIDAALTRALDRGEYAELFDLLGRASGLPGPRANIDLARSVGAGIAARGGRGLPLLDALLASGDEYQAIVGALALAARIVADVDARRGRQKLHDMAEDPRHVVREGVIAAVRDLVRAGGEPAIDALSTWTDGYLHAHVVLEALADRELLASLRSGAGVLARLDEAFALADVSPRAAERSQGVRTLRRALPLQISLFAARFPEVLAWFAERAAVVERPESRDVLRETVRALRKSSLSLSETDKLTKTLDASAPVPRDPSRIVHGTRRRSKGRG